jgi:hypothetical protein
MHLPIYDINDNELNLADFVKPKTKEIGKILLTTVMLTALNLSDKSSGKMRTKPFRT